jgi:hypothetical protein
MTGSVTISERANRRMGEILKVEDVAELRSTFQKGWALLFLNHSTLREWHSYQRMSDRRSLVRARRSTWLPGKVHLLGTESSNESSSTTIKPWAP